MADNRKLLAFKSKLLDPQRAKIVYLQGVSHELMEAD